MGNISINISIHNNKNIMLTKEGLEGHYFYIKYDKSIPEDIWKKVYSRLKEVLGGHLERERSLSDEVLKIYSIHAFQWVSREFQEGREILVSDILGDDWNKQEDKKWWKSLKKGNYVVCIKDGYNSDVKLNYIYKFIRFQINDQPYIICEWLNNNTVSAPHTTSFRLATPEEIKLYEHAGKPVDVTIYKIPEEFVLPEKWCIIKNKIEICNWFNISKGRTSSFSLNSRNDTYIHFPPTGGANVHNTIQSGYTEITFEQFKKYVLKEDFKEQVKEIEMRFEVGKWYKFKIDSGTYICRFNKLDGDIFITDTGHIYNRTYRQDSSKGRILDINQDKNFKEVPLEEIQQYLPEGHVDKVVKFKYKFNIGDKVKVIKSGYGCTEIGKEVTITERGKCADDPGYKVNPAIGNTKSGKFGGFIGEVSFELVSKDEEYKVGDWVVWIITGHVAKITNHCNAFEDSWNLREDGAHSGEYSSCSESGLRKATLEEIQKAKSMKEELELKVGEWYWVSPQKENTLQPVRALICFQGVNVCAYGFNFKGSWSVSFGDKYSWEELDRFSKASKEDVEKALLEYAKKHYPVDTKFKALQDDAIVTSKGRWFFSNNKSSQILCSIPEDEWKRYSNPYLLNDGKWAEIISSPEEKKSKDLRKVPTKEDLEEVKKYPLIEEEAFKAPVRLKLKNNKKLRINHKNVIVSNKHLIIIKN